MGGLGETAGGLPPHVPKRLRTQKLRGQEQGGAEKMNSGLNADLRVVPGHGHDPGEPAFTGAERCPRRHQSAWDKRRLRRGAEPCTRAATRGHRPQGPLSVQACEARGQPTGHRVQSPRPVSACADRDASTRDSSSPGVSLLQLLPHCSLHGDLPSRSFKHLPCFSGYKMHSPRPPLVWEDYGCLCCY